MIWQHRLTQIDEQEKLAVCARCGPVGIVFDRTNKRWRCRTAKRQHNKGRAARLLRAQLGPCCEICGAAIDLVADHNHTTGEFRGTLCRACNLAIGCFRECLQNLDRAKAYLTKRKPP